ncbi:metal-sensitive transcriptional regulator [Kordiimonas lipolytica]|uniref:Metal-sensitive transcriptional regulator n=1 Tax=Kordiimonas lipolytica TaxID=1662421 RepID=A0ABV8UGY0_9PROT|nr:metal-sensitive transcriptional regulator [Kordiimonas lipolytica]
MIAAQDRKDMKVRLARIEGQLRGLQKMMDAEDADCIKVAQQMLAARKALDKAGHAMLACMVKGKMAGDLPGGDDMDIETLIGKYA